MPRTPLRILPTTLLVMALLGATAAQALQVSYHASLAGLSQRWDPNLGPQGIVVPPVGSASHPWYDDTLHFGLPGFDETLGTLDSVTISVVSPLTLTNYFGAAGGRLLRGELEIASAFDASLHVAGQTIATIARGTQISNQWDPLWLIERELGITININNSLPGLLNVRGLAMPQRIFQHQTGQGADWSVTRSDAAFLAPFSNGGGPVPMDVAISRLSLLATRDCSSLPLPERPACLASPMVVGAQVLALEGALSVTYDYTPVPEGGPGLLAAIASLGLWGHAAMLRRRKRVA